ncbi:tetratricopeptide repeat protein [Fulvivirga ulvae]|uniref:tetratricopeptide repeat protein n=1 Tax=Fulvivirga ulvae TaxID=2904245 RepID=UPI001F3F2DA8|nr:tetratricopeptide repeat protein [Fulvivirga ulvae]UII34882.1 tetratricopeptide repeat protein [Fulvivirga ulvae]
MKLTYTLILSFVLLSCSEKESVKPDNLELPTDKAGLEQVINSNNDDDQKLAAYWELYKIDRQSNFDQAKLYLEDISILANRTGNNLFQGRVSHANGLISYRDGDYVDAVAHYLEAIDFFASLDDPIYRADALNNIGVVFMETGNYEYAIKFLTKARENYLMAKNTRFLVMVDINLGISSFSKQDPDFEGANKYFQRALELTGGLGERQDYYFNRIYNQIGVVKYKLADYNAAIHNYQLSLEYIGIGEGVEEKQAIAYANIGEAYMDQGNHAEAERWLEKSLELSSHVQNNLVKVDIHNMTAKLYQVQGMHSEAVAYLEKAIEIADKDVINESLQETIDLIRVSYKFLQNSGKPVSVARYETAFSVDGMQDSLEEELLEKANFKSLQAALGLSLELDNQIREKKAEVEQRELISNIALSLGILLIIAAILGFVYTINYRRTKKNRDEWKDVCLEVRDVLESIPN